MLYNNNRFIYLVSKDFKFLVYVKKILREVCVKWILFVYKKFMWSELYLLKMYGDLYYVKLRGGKIGCVFV